MSDNKKTKICKILDLGKIKKYTGEIPATREQSLIEEFKRKMAVDLVKQMSIDELNSVFLITERNLIDNDLNVVGDIEFTIEVNTENFKRKRKFK